MKWKIITKISTKNIYKRVIYNLIFVFYEHIFICWHKHGIMAMEFRYKIFQKYSKTILFLISTIYDVYYNKFFSYLPEYYNFEIYMKFI